MLCKYKNIFGKVGKGVHSIRIFNVAIVDVLFTIIGAYIIYLYFPKYNYFLILLILFLIGIICHRIFCVRTTIDKLLFKYI
jgi:hypothetical protein